MSLNFNNNVVKQINFNNNDVYFLNLNDTLVWVKQFTYTTGTKPRGLNTFICHRLSSLSPNVSAPDIVSNGDAIYYGDVLYWTANLLTDYDNLTYDYADSSHTYTVTSDVVGVTVTNVKVATFYITLNKAPEITKCIYRYESGWISTTSNKLALDNNKFIREQAQGVTTYVNVAPYEVIDGYYIDSSYSSANSSQTQYLFPRPQTVNITPLGYYTIVNPDESVAKYGIQYTYKGVNRIMYKTVGVPTGPDNWDGSDIGYSYSSTGLDVWCCDYGTTTKVQATAPTPGYSGSNPVQTITGYTTVNLSYSNRTLTVIDLYSYGTLDSVPSSAPIVKNRFTKLHIVEDGVSSEVNFTKSGQDYNKAVYTFSTTTSSLKWWVDTATGYKYTYTSQETAKECTASELEGPIIENINPTFVAVTPSFGTGVSSAYFMNYSKYSTTTYSTRQLSDYESVTNGTTIWVNFAERVYTYTVGNSSSGYTNDALISYPRSIFRDLNDAKTCASVPFTLKFAVEVGYVNISIGSLPANVSSYSTTYSMPTNNITSYNYYNTRNEYGITAGVTYTTITNSNQLIQNAAPNKSYTVTVVPSNFYTYTFESKTKDNKTITGTTTITPNSTTDVTLPIPYGVQYTMTSTNQQGLNELTYAEVNLDSSNVYLFDRDISFTLTRDVVAENTTSQGRNPYTLFRYQVIYNPATLDPIVLDTSVTTATSSSTPYTCPSITINLSNYYNTLNNYSLSYFENGNIEIKVILVSSSSETTTPATWHTAWQGEFIQNFNSSSSQHYVSLSTSDVTDYWIASSFSGNIRITYQYKKSTDSSWLGGSGVTDASLPCITYHYQKQISSTYQAQIEDLITRGTKLSPSVYITGYDTGADVSPYTVYVQFKVTKIDLWYP